MDLRDTAFVSMASDNDAGRLALAAFQSLRDVSTQVPTLLLLLMRGGLVCGNAETQAWHQSSGGVCAHPQTAREHVLAPELLKHLDRLGVEMVMYDAIPQTEYTKGIPGGVRRPRGGESAGGGCFGRRRERA